jgi:hypothetical protein
MREYARVSPAFWVKGSGKSLRGDPNAQLVGIYLMTCPAASMIGIYYLSIPTISHETALDPGEVRRCLSKCETVGFAFYDHDAELVWVPNMARYQIGDKLHSADKNKRTGVLNAIKQFSSHRFYSLFLEQYNDDFGLGLEAPYKPLTSPLQAPSKGDRARASELSPVLSPDHREGMQGETDGAAANPTRDGSFGMTVSAWADGVRLETGSPCTTPFGAGSRSILEAIAVHCPQGTDPIAWSRDTARAFVRANVGGKLTPFAFVDWLNSKRPTRGAPVLQQPARAPYHKRHVPPPKPSAEELERDAAEFQRMNAELAAQHPEFQRKMAIAAATSARGAPAATTPVVVNQDAVAPPPLAKAGHG